MGARVNNNEQFLTEFTREIVAGDPMKRQDKIREYAKRLDDRPLDVAAANLATAVYKHESIGFSASGTELSEAEAEEIAVQMVEDLSDRNGLEYSDDYLASALEDVRSTT